MFSKAERIAGFDEELKAALEAETRRQEEHIELIASENYTSPRVMEAQGSVLTNKYAEGYPGKRGSSLTPCHPAYRAPCTPPHWPVNRSGAGH